MKIRQIRFTVCRKPNRMLAMAAATLLAVACGNPSHGQSSLLNYLSGNSATPTQGVSVAQAGGQTADFGEFPSFGGKIPVMQASAVRTAGDLVTESSAGKNDRNLLGQSRIAPGAISQAVGTLSTDRGGVQQVGCQSCGTACGGNCGSYGDFGNSCYVPCPAHRYVTAEALYFDRRGEDGFSMSRQFFLPSYDFEWAPRVTVGYVPDCIHGYEIEAVGPFEWDRNAVVRDLTVPGPFNAAFVPGNPLAAADLDNFFDGVIQQQNYQSELFSVAASKTLIGWDAAKLLIGARYIDLDEEYFFLSQNDRAETGVLTSRALNQMFGMQVGLDLQYPIGRFVYTDFRGRAGVYANLVETSVDIQNDGAFVLLNPQVDETELAGVFEIGSGLRYQLGEMLSVRCGTELWYMTGVATAADQVDFTITPTTGTRLRADEDILFYGLTFGAELRW